MQFCQSVQFSLIGLFHELWFIQIQIKLASWSSGNAYVSGAGIPKFKSRAGQIKRSVANGSPVAATVSFLRKKLFFFFEKSISSSKRQIITHWKT